MPFYERVIWNVEFQKKVMNVNLEYEKKVNRILEVEDHNGALLEHNDGLRVRLDEMA